MAKSAQRWGYDASSRGRNAIAFKDAALTPSSFQQSLHETITWLLPRMDVSNPRWSMRSVEVRPPHEFYENDDPGFFNDSQYITYVVETRHKLVGKLPRARYDNPVGRLLLVDYKVSNHNAATEHESAGFFDWADNPPWDLWIGEYHDLLVAFIRMNSSRLYFNQSRWSARECSIGRTIWPLAAEYLHGYA